ncbi:MAG: ATP-binding cassette domain-containing protein [Phycisphaera sp.]|nr:ATP-binding cassette domain-containing protein [Phycisphaera sp.]
MTNDWIDEDDGFQPRMNWALWRKVLSFARPYRRWFLLLGVLAVSTAACDATLPLITGLIIDEVVQRGGDAHLLGYGIAYATVVLLFCSMICSFIIVCGYIVSGIGRDIRTACFDKLQALSMSFYDHRPVGWLMARLTSDCNQLSRIMGWAMLDTVWGITMLSTISAVMLTLDWRLGVSVLTIVPVLAVSCRWFQVRMLIWSRKVRRTNSNITATFNEGIMGVRTTKSLVREPENLAEFQTLSGRMYAQSVRNALYAAALLPVVLTVCSAGVGLALWLGGAKVIGGGITIGTLVIFISYAGQFQGPVQELANALTMVQGAQASAERIQMLLDAPVDVKDSDAVRALIDAYKKDNPDGSLDLAEDGLPDRVETLEFRDVSFAYEGGQRVLDGFNLRVEAGQTIALVGPTGGGKSTIVSLLCRLYEPTGGEMLVNGVDYRQRSLRWWQRQLGIVLQTPHLFNTTVRDNIRYGHLDATDDEVAAAARLAGADAFIAALPDGYDTVVGEGGDRLSTGEKQLVSLARAILADPTVLIMDEATSSVDTQTERAIQDGVERVLAGRIAFVIAHRLSTIRSADRILVIEAGRVTESGTHDELMKLGGHYHDLYTRQFTDDRGRRLLATRV